MVGTVVVLWRSFEVGGENTSKQCLDLSPPSRYRSWGTQRDSRFEEEDVGVSVGCTEFLSKVAMSTLLLGVRFWGFET